MEPILKPVSGGQLISDDWQVFQGQPGDALPTGCRWLCPLEWWQARPGESEPGSGLWLHTYDEPSQLPAEAIQKMPMIAVHFEHFADGRGLSVAVLLRNRFGYRGELRALGDILPDMLDYMCRCGFDSFLLRRAEEHEIATQNLSVMDDYYQGSVVEPRPLFRRTKR